MITYFLELPQPFKRKQVTA
jgi:hypothetical protein